MADVAAPRGLDALRWFVPLCAGAVSVGTVLAQPGMLAENVVAVAVALPFLVWAWRGMPTVVLVSIVAGAELFALRSGELEPLLFQVSVAATVIGAWEPSRRMTVVAGAIAAATPVVAAAVSVDDILYGVWMMGVLFPLGLARAFRRQVTLAYELADARQEIARQAVLDEKRRIARDVHDLVGHGLASVMLHVTGARHVLRRDVDAADEALADAEAVGRRSMQELRRTLSVLRSSDASDGSDPSTAPLPGAGELVDLVNAARAAGIDVALRCRGDVRRIDPIVGLSLHRVAKEALANVERYAPEAVTDVALVVEADTVTLTVESLGPIKGSDGSERPRYGIIGMRERMAAVGGELDAGPTRTGWQVRCWAPLAASPTTGNGDAGL